MRNKLIKIINMKMSRNEPFKGLENATGIKAKKWSHMYNGRTQPSAEMIEAIGKLFPEYAYWLITGKTIPEHGQTSPDLEQLAELQRSIGHTDHEHTEEQA